MTAKTAMFSKRSLIGPLLIVALGWLILPLPASTRSGPPAQMRAKRLPPRHSGCFSISTASPAITRD